MPNKAGKLTAKERMFTRIVASTGDAVFAATKAGYGTPAARASQNMANPALVADIQRRVYQELHEVILPLASAAHKRLLTDPLTPAGAQVAAIKLAYDHGLATKGANEKDLSEMTADELRAASLAAKAALAELEGRAMTIDNSEAVDQAPEPAKASVFD